MQTTESAVELVALARLLSLGFGVPDEEALAELETIADGLLEREGTDEKIRVALAEVRALAGSEELAAEYERLFEGAVLCPPYETSYEADPFRAARQLADVAGFYRAFGAEAQGPAAERPDHAGCELEFLAFLAAGRAAAEASGDRERAAIAAEVEDAFLRDHLGRWLPAFCRRVESEADGFYAALARLGGLFVAGELERRGIDPEPLGRRLPLAVEADCMQCGGEAGLPLG